MKRLLAYSLILLFCVSCSSQTVSKETREETAQPFSINDFVLKPIKALFKKELPKVKQDLVAENYKFDWDQWDISANTK